MRKIFGYMAKRLSPKRFANVLMTSWKVDKVLMKSNRAVGLLWVIPLVPCIAAVAELCIRHTMEAAYSALALWSLGGALYILSLSYWIKRASTYIRKKEGIGEEKKP